MLRTCGSSVETVTQMMLMVWFLNLNLNHTHMFFSSLPGSWGGWWSQLHAGEDRTPLDERPAYRSASGNS